MLNKNTNTDPGRQLQEYQTGVPAQDEQEELELVNPNDLAEGKTSSDNPPFVSYTDILRAQPVSTVVNNDYTQEALQAGYGLSRYDNGGFYPGMDLEQNRALEQSSAAKVVTGLTKGGVTAASTAVNTTLGTVFGLGSAMFELLADPEDDGVSVRSVVDAATNNWLSERMVNLQKWSEKQFPNYRTEEERSEQYQKEWYKHMGTANFIGDSILKNFGFTVGAMAGGVGWSRLLSKAMTSRLAGNLLKGAVAASEGDAEAAAIMTRAAAALRAGQTGGAAIEEAVRAGFLSAKELGMLAPKLELFGGAIGAIGEGTVEGLMAKQELLESYDNELQSRYAQEYMNLEDELLMNKDSKFVKYEPFQDAYGQMHDNWALSEDGQEELQRRRVELAKKYRRLSEFSRQQAEEIASTTAILNVPILTASNMFQFGRMFSGGWRTARTTAAKTLGKTVLNLEKEGADAIEKMSKPINKYIKGTMRAAGVALSEASEEMTQGVISSGAKEVAGQRLKYADEHIADFNNSGFDPKAIGEYVDWFSAMHKGGREYLSDIKNWQEGALGALTGLFGIPGRFWKGEWHGGLPGAFMEASDEAKESQKAVNKLKELVSGKEFQDRWRGYIRHLKYDNDMEDALANNDEKAWHTANNDQMVSDIITFAKAGRLDDLLNTVRRYGNMTEADAESLRDVLKESDSYTPSRPELDIRNMSDKEVVDRVAKRAKELEEVIGEYKDVYNEIAAFSPADASDSYIDESVFSAMRVKAFDKRFVQMFDEMMEQSDRFVTDNEFLNELNTFKTDIKNLADGVMPMRMSADIANRADNLLSTVSSLVKDDPVMKKKVDDMKEIVKERNATYDKFRKLRSDSGRKAFEEKAVTQEKVEKAAEQQKNDMDLQGINSVADVRAAFFDKNKTPDQRQEFLHAISTMENPPESVKEFLKLRQEVLDFRDFAKKQPQYSVDSANFDRIIDELILNVNSVDELHQMPDSAFSDNTGFAVLFNRRVRAMMRDFLSMKGRTGGTNPVVASKEVKPAPVAPVAKNDHSPDPTPAVPTVEELEGKKEEKKGEEKKEEPAPAQEEEPEASLPMPEKPTSDELADEVIDAQKDIREPFAEQEEEEDEDTEKDDSEKKPLGYYRTSVPEIEIESAEKARGAIRIGARDLLQTIDLSDFVIYGEDGKPIKNPDYSETWRALQNYHSFEIINKYVEKGDELCFAIISGFPQYKGEPQIVVCKIISRDQNGEVKKIQPLTPLLQSDRSTGLQYLGLSELRKSIMGEYNAIQGDKPNIFVFGGLKNPKVSHVFARPSGIIVYDYDDNAERDIKDIPSYSEEDPIIFIDRDGTPKLIRGKADNLQEMLPNSFKDALANRSDASDKRGRLYYLVPGEFGQLLPIRLHVTHINEKTIGKVDNPVIKDINTAIDRLGAFLASPKSAIEGFEGELKSRIAALTSLLDLHDIDFKPMMFSSKEDFRKYIVGLDRSINIRIGSDGKIIGFEKLIASGVITSNAEMLRQKNADLLFDPWLADRQEFGRATEESHEAAADVAGESPLSETPPPPSSEHIAPVSDLDDTDFEEDELAGPSVISRTEQEESRAEPEAEPRQESSPRGLTYDSLPKEAKDALAKDGKTAEDFNSWGEKRKRKYLNCHGL